jgi:hypothetical protein
MSHAVTTDEGMIAQVVDLLDPERRAGLRGSRPELVARYLEHQHGDDLDDIGAENLAGIISAHVRVAQSDRAGTRTASSPTRRTRRTTGSCPGRRCCRSSPTTGPSSSTR